MAKILVVDDDANCGTFLGRFLTAEGHDARVCTSAQEAIEMARPFQPSVLISDWILKNGVDGVAMAKVLREMLPGIHCLFVTGLPKESLVAEWDELSASDIFEKPIDIDGLLRAVDELAAV